MCLEPGFLPRVQIYALIKAPTCGACGKISSSFHFPTVVLSSLIFLSVSFCAVPKTNGPGRYERLFSFEGLSVSYKGLLPHKHNH